jgi:DNA-binding response OmpR family regulator
LSIALGENVSLDSIYNADEVRSWLITCGGSTPRGWLEYLRPIVSTYWDVVSSGKTRKLTKSEWTHARGRSSLYLKFDPETNQVRVGMGLAKALSPEVGAVFSYLYENQGRFCTKKELYYKAYVPFAVPQDKVKEVGDQVAFPKEYDDLINTVIYRLRQAIEPNPKDKEPVFVTTKRDVGIRLSIQAFQ